MRRYISIFIFILFFSLHSYAEENKTSNQTPRQQLMNALFNDNLSESEREKQVRTAIKNGASAKGKLPFSPGPIHVATAKNRSASTIKALLKGGAKSNASGPDNITPLINAANEGSTETIELLIHDFKVNNNINKNTALETSTLANDNTALHKAAQSQDSSLEAVKILVRNGANVEAKNRNGKTPIQLASGERKAYLKRIKAFSEQKGITTAKAAKFYDFAKNIKDIYKGFKTDMNNVFERWLVAPNSNQEKSSDHKQDQNETDESKSSSQKSSGSKAILTSEHS